MCELILMNVVVDVITDCCLLSFIWFIRLWLLPIQSNTSPRPPLRINHYLQKESILNTKYPFKFRNISSSVKIYVLSEIFLLLKIWSSQSLYCDMTATLYLGPYTAPNKMDLTDFFIDRRQIYWYFIRWERTSQYLTRSPFILLL